MARPAALPRPKGAPGVRFRVEIESALAEGVDHQDLTLHLTLRDASVLMRDPATPMADIRFDGSEMRYLGVKVEKGGIAESALVRREA